MGVKGDADLTRDAGRSAQTRTLERVLAWARTAPPADPQAVLHQRLAATLDDDRPVGRARTILAVVALVILILCFTPVPIEPFVTGR